MPKLNVDNVDLYALQELATATNPLAEDYVYFGKKTELVGKKLPIEQLGNIIANQLGSAANKPDRVYQPGMSMPDGATLIIDDNPGSPTYQLAIGINDAYLNGLVYSVLVRGTERLIKGQEWQNDVVGGGFRFTDGRIIEDGTVIIIDFKPQISSVISAPDAVARFLDANGVYLVPGTMQLTPASQRKLIYITASDTVVTVTLDPTYPQGVLCAVLTGNSNQKQTTILPGPGFFAFNGTASKLVLGQSEWAFMVRYGSIWYVVSISDNWQRVGEIVMGGLPGPNRISANGQLLSIPEYPRLDDYLTRLNAALPGSVVPLSAWENDKTKWGRDANNIRVPKLGGWFPRFLDLGSGKDTDRGTAGNIQGSIQRWAEVDHTHPISSNPNDSIVARSPNQGGGLGLNNSGNGWEKSLGHSTLGMNGILPGNISFEARPENVGLPALICI